MNNNFLDWNTLEFKKRSGLEKIKCPACISQRTNKRDKSLSINHNKGFGKCHYGACGALVFRDSEKNYSETEKVYTTPKQDWKNYTNLSDVMVKYLESRKIPQSVAIELGWTEELHWQPQKEKKVVNLVYNFFEGEKVVNKKYRSGDKKFTQSRGGKPILYNINSVVGEKEVYIVEGEMDVAALYAVGIKNVVSVPSGANDNDDYWINSKPYIDEAEHFVIAVDTDDAGNKLKELIAQRLGRYRCSYIEWKGKDANDDLISGDLEETVRHKKRFPVSGTLTVDDLWDDVLELYKKGLPDTVKPKDKSFGDWRKHFSVLRGQLTVVTGIPSHGKSNFNDWYVLNLIKDFDLKCSWFTPEHSPDSLYQRNLIEKVSGQNFWGKVNDVKVPRISEEDLEKYREWASEKIYITKALGEDYPKWDWLLEKFKEQMFSFGVDIFVIDAFNKVVLDDGNELREIRKVLTKLTAFAQNNNVLIFLVAHPRKMAKNDKGVYNIPNLYDVSGSADFRNMTHNGYTVYRTFEDEELGAFDNTMVVNMKTKFNFQGKMAETESYQYNPLNGRYYAGKEDNTPFWGLEEKKDLPVMTLHDAFDEPEKKEDLEDEVPF